MLTQKSELHWIIATFIGLMLFGAGCASAYEYKGSVLEPPLPIPDFELNDTNNQSFHLSDVESDITLIYFGYTFCPDVCPLTLADVKTALTNLEGRERVKLIFITVDPERDTPEVLARYLNAFDPEFIGLTDDFEKIEAMMKPFGAYAEKDETTDSAAGYLVSHTARLYLVNPQRELLMTYPFQFEPEDLRSDLAYLLRQK
jgi:protein SCO1/2